MIYFEFRIYSPIGHTYLYYFDGGGYRCYGSTTNVLLDDSITTVFLAMSRDRHELRM